MQSRYMAVLRHGHAENNDAEDRHRNGDARAYDEVVTFPSSLHDLTSHGKSQAQKTGKWIEKHGLRFSRHIVSGYVRALRTASLLDIPNAQWEIEERLCEKDSGIYNTLTPSGVQRYLAGRQSKRQRDDIYRDRPEGGESFLDLEVRVRSVFEFLTDRPLVVCHGHVIRVFDRIVMRRMNAWEFGSFKDTRGDIPNGALIEYRRIDSSVPDHGGELWQCRMSIPHRDDSPGEWTDIVPVRHSNADLSQLITSALALSSK